MRERDVHSYLAKRVKALNGEIRRMKWIGRSNAPDVMILLPGRHLFAEEKRPGEEARDAQAREHIRMRGAGCEVYLLDSIEAIDNVLPPPTKP